MVAAAAGRSLLLSLAEESWDYLYTSIVGSFLCAFFMHNSMRQLQSFDFEYDGMRDFAEESSSPVPSDLNKQRAERIISGRGYGSNGKRPAAGHRPRQR